MNVSYYPGCSLHGTAREYDESVRAVCGVLGVKLDELHDWNCCGASSAHSVNEALSIALPARNLEIAEKAGQDLVVPCAACYQRLKRAEKRLAGPSRTSGKDELGIHYEGKIKINHLLDFLSHHVSERDIKAKVQKPLAGLKPVAYYGCLAMRPPKVTDAANSEDPQTMDSLLCALGAEVKPWSYKTDCCGGGLSFTRRDVMNEFVKRLFDMAGEAGADCLVTACPLCQANLDNYQAEVSQRAGKVYDLPVFYFTELMGLAFGLPGARGWFGRHITDPRPLLQQRGLL